jgi:uncharacterized protein (TIGR03000 family)
MFRLTAALALLLAFSAEAWAQLIARPGPRIVRPAGVIQPPSLPFVGSQGVPSPVQPPRVLPRPFLGLNPYNDYFPYGFGGYAPYWPGYYDYDSMSTTNNVPLATVPEPRPAPVSAPPTSAPPPETKARLTLNVPPGAVVTLAGQEVDSAANPVLLESPDLREGQRYTFDIRVTWKERNKMQERARKVVIDVGDTKSLTYTAQQ